MPIYIDPEELKEDILYLEGYAEGFAKGFAETSRLGPNEQARKIATHLLKKGLSTKAIAAAISLDEKAILRIKEEMEFEDQSPSL